MILRDSLLTRQADSVFSLQGRRAADPLHQQQPGETGHTSGGQAGGGNNSTSQGDTSDFLLWEIELSELGI